VLRKIASSNALENTTIEYPLDKWIDMRGSKVKFVDFFKAFIELAKIYFVLNFPVIKNKYSEKFK
jgi:hypothetical protein